MCQLPLQRKPHRVPGPIPRKSLDGLARRSRLSCGNDPRAYVAIGASPLDVQAPLGGPVILGPPTINEIERVGLRQKLGLVQLTK